MLVIGDGKTLVLVGCRNSLIDPIKIAKRCIAVNGDIFGNVYRNVWTSDHDPASIKVCI